MYDSENIFAKIIRGEIPSKKIYENEYAMSFYNINPLFDTHVLVIPKGEYKNMVDFYAHANDKEKLGFAECFKETAKELGIEDNFNAISNAGPKAPFIVPEIPHFHIHLVFGERKPAFYDEMKIVCK